MASTWTQRLIACTAVGALAASVALAPASAQPTDTPKPSEAVVAGSVEDEVTKAFATDLEVKPGKASDGVEVGRDSDDGIQLATNRRFRSVEVGLPGDSSDAAVKRGAAVFQGVADATSLVVQAVDVDDIPELRAGVRTLVTIESAAAPSSYTFSLDLPPGAAAQRMADGSVAVMNIDGSVLGMFASPWAVDAAGRSLPTSFEVTPTGLVQHVDHRGAAYPVIADPAWFIPVIIVGVRAMVPIVVRASTKAAAKRAAAAAAKAAAKRAGSKVKSVGSVVKIRAYTAGGHKIRPGVRYKTGYSSFGAFKSKFGNRRDYDWHHIVEQKHVSRGKKFGAKSIHNKNNLVQVPRKIHQKCVNSLMSTKPATGPVPYRVIAGTTVGNGRTLRQAIDGMRSYDAMHAAGVRLLRYCGVPI